MGDDTSPQHTRSRRARAPVLPYDATLRFMRRRLRGALALALLACSTSNGGGSNGDAGVEGGAVDPIWFREIGQSAGFTHVRADAEYGTLQGRMSGGVCVLDADADGSLDVFFPGSSVRGTGSHLYMSRGGKLAFAEDSAARGVADTGDSSGCVAFDVDGDGDSDLLTTGFGGPHLFTNDAGHFTDASARLGGAFGAEDVATSAVAFDADGDGDLDLAIGVYGRFKGAPASGSCNGPCVSDILQYDYGPTRLLLQNADGTFADASSRLGAGFKEPNLVMLATDLDDDGNIDLFVGNDITTFQDRYYRGDGRGAFVEIAQAIGVARDARGDGIFSMSASDGDIDGDGKLDLVESTWDDGIDPAFRCQGKCVDVGADTLGLSKTPHNFRWGQALVDFDDDGISELFEASGHYQVASDRPDAGFVFPTKDFSLVWHRRSFDAPFALDLVSRDLVTRTAGRGVAAVDFDGDGALDVVVGTAFGRPLLFQNVRANRGHSLDIRLAGKGKNTRGIGARVTARASGRVWTAVVHAGSSFMSSDDARVHFGLGSVAKLDSVDVRWPSGAMSHLNDVTIGAGAPLRIAEP